MDSISVPREMFYFLLGNFIVEEKKKEGLRVISTMNEELFKTSVGLFVYSVFVNPLENLEID
jgi:hypothetical protein